jgi:hypothetical protein
MSQKGDAVKPLLKKILLFSVGIAVFIQGYLSSKDLVNQTTETTVVAAKVLSKAVS